MCVPMQHAYNPATLMKGGAGPKAIHTAEGHGMQDDPLRLLQKVPEL